MRFRTPLSILTLLAAACAATALRAQDLQYDTHALDPSGAAAPAPKAKKGKKAQQSRTPAGAEAAKPPSKPGGDRQFGELEGWSPGKTPPKAKDDNTPSAPGQGPVSVSPTGNLGVGLPF